MSATTTIVPEVQLFIEQVRAQLADLEADELREITDGLEADLSELVADRGIEALGDPVAYAGELRAAAGLTTRAVKRPREVRASIDGFLDACHAWVVRRVEALPGDARPLLTWLRPVWWIARAWAAVALVEVVFGANPWSGVDVVPHLRGFGWVILSAAILVSVQLGRGRLWPGGDRGVVARVVLLGLNVFAIGVVPLMVGQVEHGADTDYWNGYDAGYRNAVQTEISASGDKAGLYANGSWVSQIYPYDAQGEPLVGVQLFDQTGQPLAVVTQTECVYTGDANTWEADWDSNRVYYPWTDGASQKHNVFPVPSRVQDAGAPEADPMAFLGADKPGVGPFPFEKVAPISLPGLLTSAGSTPAGAVAGGTRPDVPINPADQGC